MDNSPADSSADGQVSEVQNLDAAKADQPVSDDQSVAGQPDSGGGEVQEGRIGPNARTGSQHADEKA